MPLVRFRKGLGGGGGGGQTQAEAPAGGDEVWERRAARIGGTHASGRPPPGIGEAGARLRGPHARVTRPGVSPAASSRLPGATWLRLNDLASQWLLQPPALVQTTLGRRDAPWPSPAPASAPGV